MCVYMYIYMHTHILTYIYIYIYIEGEIDLGGNLRFLPVSQSEGPTEFLDVLYVGGDGAWPYGIWLILKDHLCIPQGICVQKQERAGLALLGALDEISPLGLFLPPSVANR